MSGNYSVHTNPIVSVQISSSDGPNKFIPIEKNISRNESVRAIKGRLEVITSADRNTMTVKVYDRNDKLVCVLDNDDTLLGSYHIDDGMRLHVEDEFRLSKSLENDSNVEKFVMPEEDYVKRTEKSSDVTTTIVNSGLSMSCPGKKGKLSDLKHKDTKQPRRPKLVDGDSFETNQLEEPPKQEETPNIKANDKGVEKNLFVRKCTARISNVTPPVNRPLTPIFAESSKSSSLVSPVNQLTSKIDNLLIKSTLRPTADEFTPSKRIPIIDPRTNREIVLDDVIPNGHAGDSASMSAHMVGSLLYNSGYRVDVESHEGAEFNNGNGDTVQIEIGKTIDYIVRQLLVNPGSFDDLMKIFDVNINVWGVLDSTVEFILACIIDMTVGLNNFSYLGAKICCHLEKTVSKIRPDGISIRNLLLAACEVKFCELKNWLMGEDTRNTAYSFIFFLAELYDQFMVQGTRIKALCEALCGTYNLLMEDPNNFNIRCLCKVLKLTGRNMYQDNGAMLQGIMAQLKDIHRSHMFDSQTSAMLSSVIGLANCHWGLDESANGISPVTALRAEGKGAEMYGPDGNILSFEEKKFLVDNLGGLPDDEESLQGLQDSYADSDDGMDEEMQEAFEQFLLSVPEAR